MTTRPCGSRNLYCFLHRLSAVPPFYIDSPRSVHPKQWGLLQNTRKASPTITAILFPLGAAAVINAADIITRIPQPEYFSFYFPASAAFQRKRSTLHANRTAGRRLNKIIFPEPPLALHRIRIPGVYKVFHGTIKIQLAAVKSATAQPALLGIKFFGALATQ